MRNFFKIIIAFTFIIGYVNAMAQSDMTLHGLRVVAQNNYNNPAFIPESEHTIGIPVISSISNSTYSSTFSFNDLFTSQQSNDSLYLNLSKIANNSEGNNYITEYFENDLIYVAFKKNNSFFNFGIRNRLFSRAMYSSDLVKLLWNGNANYIDEGLNLTNTFVNHDHFLSYYAGFAININDNINLGLRVNLNQGLSSIQTINSLLTFTTVSQTDNVYSLNANADFLINTSGLVSDSASGGTASISEYIFNFQNLGFSVDFGADIKLSERLRLNLSVVDLGFINWKSGLQSYQNSSDSIDFSGIIVDVETTDDLFQAYGDSLVELINLKEFQQSFTTNLRARIYSGLEYYSYDKTNRLSIVFAGTFLKDNFSPAFSVGYDKTVSKNFAFKVNYTYLKYAPLNLGAGLIFNFRPFQFYVITDNILSTFYWNGQKYLNFRVGVNLIFSPPRSIKHGEPIFYE